MVDDDKPRSDEVIFDEDEDVEDERKAIERAVSRLRERVGRRQKKKEKKGQRRGVKGPVPKVRGRSPEFLTDQLSKGQPPPTTSKKEEPRKWLNMGWMIEAVLNGHKTLALMPWTAAEANEHQKGDLFEIFDSPPSRGGKKMVIIRLTQTPYEVRTDELSKGNRTAMGFEYLKAFGTKSPGGMSMDEVEEGLKNKPTKLWAVHFKIEQLVDKEAPIRETVEVD